MHGMTTQDDDDDNDIGRHGTHPQPYEQLLTGVDCGCCQAMQREQLPSLSTPLPKRSPCERDDEQ
jgi:hypothetical protein